MSKTVNLKKWKENSPVAIVGGIAGGLITLALSSLNDYYSLKDRAEARAQTPEAHIRMFDSQYPDRIVLSILLRNPTNGSTSFSDFMLTIQKCSDGFTYTYPTYLILSNNESPVLGSAKPINVPSKEKTTATIAFLVLPNDGESTHARNICSVKVIWFDEYDKRHETKPLMLDKSTVIYQKGGAGG